MRPSQPLRRLRREVEVGPDALLAEGFLEIAGAVLADEAAYAKLDLIDIVRVRVEALGEGCRAQAACRESDVDDEVAARDVLVAAQRVERAGEGAGTGCGVYARSAVSARKCFGGITLNLSPLKNFTRTFLYISGKSLSFIPPTVSSSISENVGI